MLQVVSEKTGYPVEMLELDMEMEADLGVDRVKLAEIAGALRDRVPAAGGLGPDALAGLHTLEDLALCLHKGSAAQPSSWEAEQPAHASRQEEIVPRGLARLKRLPLPDALDFRLPEGHVCVVTDDGTSNTVGVAEALVEKGWRVVVLSFPPSVIPEGPASAWGIPRVALKELSEKHLGEKLQEISDKDGPIGGVIHLHPFFGEDGKGGMVFSETSRDILLHVFLMAKHLQPSLTRTIPPGRRFFMTVARLDGCLGVTGGDFGLVDGGLFGLVKTLNLEWDSVFCRAVDLSPSMDDETSISSILQELHDPDGRIVETGYGDQGRVTLVAEPSVPSVDADGAVPLDASSVFVVSGGGKGVTASCIAGLASRCRCRFVLLGRSRFADEEPEWARGCEDPAELKKLGMEHLKGLGEKPTPKKVEELLKPVLDRREISSTLKAIRDAGGEAEYVQADVTDVAALEQVGPVVERLGQLTGLIHGAGVLADRLIEKKTIRDFESVYATKVKGLEALLRSVDGSRLQYLILFSSAAGFYGNPGQSDYSMANEILNKAAYRFKRRHPDCRVRAFNWGPWDGGMVSDSLKKLFEGRNIQVIPVDGGTRVFVEGFSANGEESPQILVGSSMRVEGGGRASQVKAHRIVRKLKREANPFLEDHVIGGHPVLPAAFVMAWMADGCEQVCPGYRFVRCEDFQTLKGIAFDHAVAEACQMEIQEVGEVDSGEVEFEVKVSSLSSRGKRHDHYTAHILLAPRAPEPPVLQGFERTESEVIGGAALYENATLFHGPGFQVVDRVLRVAEDRLTMECRLPVIGEDAQGQFPIRDFNPYAVDALFQAMLVWVRRQRDAGSLPSSVQILEPGASMCGGQRFYVSLEVKNNGRSSLVADATAHDESGTIYWRMLGAEVTISKRLDELFRKTTSA
jgi:polyketide-type polyunsaturated fatty acid synthase PfaA